MSNKPRISFKIPGKTFLLGEYLAVFGGPSIVLATGPYFEINFTAGEGCHSFHRESPAGRYVNMHRDFFSAWNIDFRDPFDGQGGFGASTAQFIAVYLMHGYFDLIESGEAFDMHDLGSVVMPAWHAYRDLFAVSENKSELKPSGADLIAQMRGGLSFFRGRDETFKALDWPFIDTDVVMLKTPYKINTHEHLADLQIEEWPLGRMEVVVEKTRDALMENNLEMFLEGGREFSSLLRELGLVHGDVQKLVEDISRDPAVRGARGCGALGADVVAVFTDKQRSPETAAPSLKKMAALGGEPAYGVWVEVN